ncbi:SusC/RagA family TonB-linked outer membrane protein [Dyadobacter psychrotolerans]|uniref:SusC/RagA family TonB-linked outer membrane protein n=2 Tax=Dyadobacter psychrotolerans TaxID=2541721 RepID=A0A4R5DP81_9BACT|nr:SusC/RagA family TonB-linked outer membrane protein [Dyadobacter psychrotolerans]
MVGAPVMAQTITGKITDGKGSAIPGASVIVKGTTKGTTSDLAGTYSIDVAGGNTLVVSFIGFVTKETAVGNSSVLDISLSEDNLQLGEVVVTALGIQKESRQIGYSVQKVESKDITKVAPPNLAQGLMGKVAGLNISTPNGVEGGSQRIVIRGNNSLLGNNQPLLVIDGVQVQENAMGLDNKSGTQSNDLGALKDWGSYLNFINSDDVQEVNVLKGPTAAALYGARGANGVILITTKKGTKKPGLGIDYNFSTRWTQAYRYQDFQNEYGYGGAIGLWSADKPFPTDAAGNPRYPAADPWSGANIPDKFASQGSVPGGLNSWGLFSWYGTGASWGHKLDGTEITWWDGTKRKWEPNPDNIKSFFKTGNTTTHNVSFSGGGEFGTVRVSLSRSDNKAIVPNSNYDQTTVNIGSNIDISKKIKAEATSSYTRFNRLNTPNIGDNNSWTKFMVYGMSRDYKNIEKDVYKNADGSKNMFNTDKYPLSYPYAGYGKDIYWNAMERNTNLQRDQLLGSVKLSAEITPWFNLVGRTGIDYNTNEFESKYTPTDIAGLNGEYGYEMNKNYTITSEVIGTLHTDHLFTKDLTASLTGGGSSWYNRYHGSKQWNAGPFGVPYQYFLRNTTATLGTDYTKWLPEEYRQESKINSVYGIVDLGYKDYLFLQVTGRNDWSSTLPTATNSFFYPSASLSFVFTEAFGMESTKSWLDFGKLRVAYAASANGTDPYRTSYVYTAGAFGGSPTRSLQKSLPPLALEPQRSKSFELGTQLGFLNNRLGLDVSYYQINSTSQILSAPLPVSSGVESVTFNTGELQNKGFEFILRGSIIKQNNFTWDATFNGAHNQNKVVSLDQGVDTYPLGDVFGITYGAAQQVRVGENYGTIYGYDYKIHANGKRIVQKIMDADGKKVVGTKYVTTDAPVAIGNSTPKLTGGLGNNIRYKDFSFYALIDYKFGGQIYSTDYAAAMGNGLAPETLLERNGGGLPYTYPDETKANHGVILDGVFEDGTPNTDVVNYMFKYASVYGGWSDIHMPRSASVFENSWAKLRELSLTYTVPKSIAARTKVFQGLSLSVIGRDLFYLFTTLPDNLNPEGVNGIGNTQGLQWSAFPGTRTYGFSIKAQL